MLVEGAAMIPAEVVHEHIVPALVRAGEVEEWKERCRYWRHLLLGTYIRRWMESALCKVVERDGAHVEDTNRAHFDAWWGTLCSFERDHFTPDEIWADYLWWFVP